MKMWMIFAMMAFVTLGWIFYEPNKWWMGLAVVTFIVCLRQAFLEYPK